LEGLEDHLSGRRSTAARALDVHLASCADCRELVASMRAHSASIQTLRAEQELDPVPGFYARVLDRIEAQTANSFWNALLEPMFMRRFMYASLALLVILGSAVYSVNPSPQLLEMVPMEIAADVPMPQAAGGNAESDREMVFANLASYTGTAGFVPTLND
jgi:hypothetical protein